MLILHGFIPLLKLRKNHLYKLGRLCCDATEAEKWEKKSWRIKMYFWIYKRNSGRATLYWHALIYLNWHAKGELPCYCLCLMLFCWTHCSRTVSATGKSLCSSLTRRNSDRDTFYWHVVIYSSHIQMKCQKKSCMVPVSSLMQKLLTYSIHRCRFNMFFSITWN